MSGNDPSCRWFSPTARRLHRHMSRMQEAPDRQCNFSRSTHRCLPFDWAAGRSCTGKRECSSCHPPPCGSDRPQSTPRRFRFGCVCAHSNFDGGQRDADCLTPQLRTNGRLADGMKGRESVRTDATCPHPVAAPRLVHGAAKTKH